MAPEWPSLVAPVWESPVAPLPMPIRARRNPHTLEKGWPDAALVTAARPPEEQFQNEGTPCPTLIHPRMPPRNPRESDRYAGARLKAPTLAEGVHVTASGRLWQPLWMPGRLWLLLQHVLAAPAVGVAAAANWPRHPEAR